MEEINKNDKQTIDFESIKLEDFDLSTSTYSCLINANIRDLSQLVNMSEEDLRNVKNMGMLSFEEIMQKVEEKLNELGITLEEARELQQKRSGIKPLEISLDPYVSHRRLQQIRDVEKLEAELIERAEARRLQRNRDEQNAGAGKVVQKEQMLQMFEGKIVTLLSGKPCRDFTKNSQSYEDIAKMVEDFLNETLDTEMQKAQSEEEILLIQETLEEMREIFKKIVDSKRKNITIEEKKFAASDIEKYKNTELKKYRKKQPNIMDPTFDVDAHNYNPFSDTDELGL